MAGLLLALALAASLPSGAGKPLPPPSKAQPANDATLRAVGEWGQRLVAAQQPTIDAFQRCDPMVRRMVALVRTAEAGGKDRTEALIPEMRACLADARAAAAVTRDALAGLTPLPPAAERVLRASSRDMLRRTALAMGEMVNFLDLMEQAIDAGLAGDQAGAERNWAQAMRSAGAAMDAQILILETVRAGMLLDTHRAMADIRLNINRAVRVITVADFAGTGVPAQLRRFGVEQRAAATRMRSHWQIEQRQIRSALSRLDAGRRGALFAAADTAMNAIAQCGEDSAALLEGARDDGGEAQLIELSNELAAVEVRVLDAIRTMSASISGEN